MKKLCLLLVLACAWSAEATVTTLYDGATETDPFNAPAFFYYLTDNAGDGVPATQTPLADGIRHDTFNDAGFDESAGWFTTLPVFNIPRNAAMPALDRDTGYRIGFELAIVAEGHDSLHRSGFSFIALGDDSYGLEVGFWGDEVWAQSTSFLHAEGAALDTTARRWYDFYAYGSEYALWTGGAPLLTGSLRDYSGFGPPYDTTDFVFLGDDTSSAGSTFDWFHLEIETEVGALPQAPSVPEPGTIALLAGGLLALRRRRR